MTNQLYPQFDQFTASWTPAKESQELRRFCELHPEHADSLQALKEFCAVQVVPLTLYNLEVGLAACIAEGRIANRAIVTSQVDQVDEAAEAAAEAENEAEVEAAREFMRQCPDFDKGFASRHNADLLLRFVKSRRLPVTAGNLLKAFHHCIKTHAFRPPEPQQAPVRIDAAVEARRKYADKPYESDVARKKRDEKLRLAADADRIARRNGQ